MTLPPEDRDLIEQRVRNEIQREISHETWRGLRVESYRFKVPIPPELRGSEWDWGYCSHWSTHPGAEPLVSLFDVAQAIAAVRAEAAPVVDDEMVERARLALHRVRYERMKRMLNGDRRALGERSPGDPPDMQEDARAALEAALNPSREVKS